jgi:MFS family permease
MGSVPTTDPSVSRTTRTSESPGAEARDPDRPDRAAEVGWRAVLRPAWIPSLSVLLGGVLLHSMNVLLLATVLPSIVDEVGGAAMLSWVTTAFLASSIVAATGTGLLTGAVGARRTFAAGALVFCAGALVCAFAPTMDQVVAGRFVQGFGGGLLSAVVYVLVHSTFPETVWPRVFALLAGVWSVSVLVGPLVGGVFARYGSWRGAFLAVAGLAGLLALVGLRTLPAPRVGRRQARPRVPVGRVTLICLAILAVSVAAIADRPAAKAALIAAAVAALAVTLRLDRASVAPLMPRDAFSLHSTRGVGLWIALLVSIAFAPLHLFVPLFLQTLHGFDPLGAGYTVASASMAWTLAALTVAGLPDRWPDRAIVAGPFTMGAGLLGVGVAMPAGPVAAVIPTLVLVGAGIGACWAFTAQRIMQGPGRGEETLAASSVATVQQVGFALGAAVAGLIANTAGLSAGRPPTGIARAAFWVPASFVLAAATAGLLGVRLAMVTRRAGAPMRQPPS